MIVEDMFLTVSRLLFSQINHLYNIVFTMLADEIFNLFKLCQFVHYVLLPLEIFPNCCSRPLLWSDSHELRYTLFNKYHNLGQQRTNVSKIRFNCLYIYRIFEAVSCIYALLFTSQLWVFVGLNNNKILSVLENLRCDQYRPIKSLFSHLSFDILANFYPRTLWNMEAMMSSF